MFKQFQHIKSLITIAFIVLVGICLAGLALIYKQLLDYSETSTSHMKESKELLILSNTLATLYKTESVGNLLMLELIPEIQQEYDSLTLEIYSQIDSLRRISKDIFILQHLDSVNKLLQQKHENTKEMFGLLDSVDKERIVPVFRTTIISKKDIDSLNQILSRNINLTEDTFIVEAKKRSFLQRVRNVFKEETDSQLLISKNKVVESLDTSFALTPIILDTITEYINEQSFNYGRRNRIIVENMVKKLMSRQNVMHITNEELTIQINKILREIEAREYQRTISQLQEKEQLLSRSAEIAYRFTMIALIIMLCFLVIIYKFISNSQKYRLRLEESKRYAENLLESRERLVYSITHDIKSPISSIIGYIELLSNGKLPPREKYYTKNMQTSAEHILRLVKNLLDFYSLDSDNQSLNQMSFVPYILFRDIFVSFTPIAEKKQIQLNFDCSLSDQFVCESDPYHIRQVLDNLISNAIKFTQSGGIVSLIVKEEKGKDDQSQVLSITVQDTGYGISKENQQIIFEEFKRGNRTKEEGTGLGLPICKKIVHLLNGEISFESELGKGTTFSVKLPVKLSESNLPDSKETPTTSLSLEQKILFIDDDVIQLNLYSEKMKGYGFIPTICNSSIEALTLISQKQFDIIFTDIQMPEINGFELVNRIRNSSFRGGGTVPVIALSASTNISEQKFIEAGFSGFLSKPFTSNQLLEVLGRFTGKENVNLSMEENTSELKGFDALICFATDDKNAAREIVRSFIDENRKNTEVLQIAFKKKDWHTIGKIAHKMLPLMRMISASEIVAILLEFQKENQKDKKECERLVLLIRDLLNEAEVFLKKL